MMRSEPLAGAIDCGEGLLRRDRAVPAGHRVAAIVAIPARRVIALSEIAEQCLAAARGRFAETDQRLGFLTLYAALPLADVARFSQAPQVHYIRDAVRHPGICRQPVAPGPAGLLVIGFEVLRRVEMGDEADIGLVDTHAEGDCRDDDDAFLAQEAVLVPNPRFGRQTRVIWQRRAPPLSQPGCGVLDRAPRQAVNNVGFNDTPATEKAQQIVARILLRNYTIEQIGAVIACGEQPGRAEMQTL